MRIVVLLLFCTLACFTTITLGNRIVGSHLSPNDLTRFEKVFRDGLVSFDLQSYYYATSHVKHEKDYDQEFFCEDLQRVHQQSGLNSFEKDFYYIGTNKNMNCSTKIPENVLSQVYGALNLDLSTAQEIYYRVATHKILNVQINEATKSKIVKKLQELLKKEDTLVNFGYAFNVAAELGSGAEFVADRVEDAIVQADEVDGRLLQFEGGLSITALVINGAFAVNKAFNKPVPITSEQAVKFANYFLSRRSVQSSKGAHILIQALKTLSSDSKISPICLQIIGNGNLQPDSLSLNIAAVDLLGKALTPALQNINAKIMRKKDGSVVAEKLTLTSKSSDKTTYAVDLTNLKLPRGIYQAELIANNVYKQMLQFKVLGRVKVKSVEFGVAESDASSPPRFQAVAYPDMMYVQPIVDSTQKMLLKIVLVDEDTGKPISVQQAFVRIFNRASYQDKIFMAEQDNTKAYKFELDVPAQASNFLNHNGIYEIFFIVGDASLANPFQWQVAEVLIKFKHVTKENMEKEVWLAPRPTIEHQFRVPEKRPPRIVSDVFTGLCLTPLVLLFIFWGKLGINVSNFSLSLSTIGFHGGFGGILTLFTVFWLQLNMFQTLRLLIPIAVLTFLCGNRLLRRIYAQRVSKTQSVAS